MPKLWKRCRFPARTRSGSGSCWVETINAGSLLRRFHLRYQCIERGKVVDCQLRELLAVEQNPSFADAFHKTAVGDALRADGGIDAHSPQTLEIALFAAAVAVGVLACAGDGLLGVFIEARTVAEIAGGGF